MGKLVTDALVGTSGIVYIDGVREAYVESINVKTTGNFEDLDVCGIYESDYAYTGCKSEGTMTIVRSGSDYTTDTLEAFETGNIKPMTIVSKLTQKSTGKTESFSIQNVVPTEITAVDFKKGVVKQTIPFKCSLPKKVSSI